MKQITFMKHLISKYYFVSPYPNAQNVVTHETMYHLFLIHVPKSDLRHYLETRLSFPPMNTNFDACEQNVS